MDCVERKQTPPPDGGARAYVVLFASFLCNGLIFGIVNTYSVLYVELQKRLEENNISEASSKASLVGSLAIGTTFLLSPISGMLTDRIGIRLTTFIGGGLSASALLISSFLTHKVEYLYFTYGVLFGVGASLTYTPSLTILGHYFKDYLGIANGFVTAGSSLFTTIVPFLLEYLLSNVGLEGCLRYEALLVSTLMLCSLAFKPLIYHPTICDKDGNLKSYMSSFINTDIWKSKKYKLWIITLPIALFGYFVPYVHLAKFVKVGFPDLPSEMASLPIVCIAITSGIGRLVFGRLSDFPKVDRILLQQIAFFTIGVLTILIAYTSNFILLLAISLGMGLFDGCFITLIGPIAFDLCGPKGAAQAIGFLLGFSSFPLTIGPPIAGLIYDKSQSYKLPFTLAGIPPIIGALALNAIRFTTDDNNDNQRSPIDEKLEHQLLTQIKGIVENDEKICEDSIIENMDA